MAQLLLATQLPFATSLRREAAASARGTTTRPLVPTQPLAAPVFDIGGGRNREAGQPMRGRGDQLLDADARRGKGWLWRRRENGVSHALGELANSRFFAWEQQFFFFFRVI